MPKVIKQSTDASYRVSTRRLYDLTDEQIATLNEDGNDPTFAGVYGNFRKGVKTALGSCSERYGIVQTPDVIDEIEGILSDKGLDKWEKTVRVIGNGERNYVTYDLKDKNHQLKRREDRRVGDELGLRLTVKNSYDRSLRLSVQLGFLRLVCTNGMVALAKEFELTRRHQSGIDIGFLGEGITKALGMADEQALVFDRLGETEIKQSQGATILANLEKKKIITSGNMKDSIEAIWNDPSYGEDNGRNLYNLYNATTQHLTRVVEPKRYELANKVNTNVLRKLNKMSLDENTLKSFLLPIKVENN
jgi:K+/H+ antiporter YhaU regulatory subunit KhtT